MVAAGRDVPQLLPGSSSLDTEEKKVERTGMMRNPFATSIVCSTPCLPGHWVGAEPLPADHVPAWWFTNTPRPGESWNDWKESQICE